MIPYTHTHTPTHPSYPTSTLGLLPRGPGISFITLIPRIFSSSSREFPGIKTNIYIYLLLDYILMKRLASGRRLCFVILRRRCTNKQHNITLHSSPGDHVETCTSTISFVATEDIAIGCQRGYIWHYRESFKLQLATWKTYFKEVGNIWGNRRRDQQHRCWSTTQRAPYWSALFLGRSSSF